MPGEPPGGPQIWYGDTGAVALGHVAFSEGTDRGDAKFRIYTPDSRLLVKVSAIFLRDDPTDTTPVRDLGATIYMGEEEHDRSGFNGADVLCTDVLKDAAGAVVHRSAPLLIPEDDGLDGFTMEFVTAADSILGIFTTGQNGPAGHWIVQVRYQPDGQRLCADDWDWVKRKCHATLLGPQINLTASL